MAIERTLSIIKPDATRRNLTGAINDRLERRGLRIVAQKRIRLTEAQAERFYEVHAERPFYRGLVAFMTSGPIVVQVLEGEDAVALNREIMGATNPANAAPGTIRKDFAEVDRGEFGAWFRTRSRMPLRRSPFSSPQSKYARSLGRQMLRAAGMRGRNRQMQKVATLIGQDESALSALSRLTSDRTARRIATWCEAGLDAAAVPFFPLLVLVPRGIVRARLGRRAVCGRFGAVGEWSTGHARSSLCWRRCSGVCSFGGRLRRYGRWIRCAASSSRRGSPASLRVGLALADAANCIRRHAG